MYITINNEKYELTTENICELNRQEAIEAARNAIDFAVDAEYVDIEAVENLTEYELATIGEDILNRIFGDTGNIEYNVLEWYGLIKEV